jgi:hypothetical protein
MDESLAEQQTAERHAEWPNRLPREPEALCIFIYGLSDDERMGLLASDRDFGNGCRPDGSGRDFAAWIGLVPRQESSGGKQKLG